MRWSNETKAALCFVNESMYFPEEAETVAAGADVFEVEAEVVASMPFAGFCFAEVFFGVPLGRAEVDAFAKATFATAILCLYRDWD